MSSQAPVASRRRWELGVFLFVTAVLIPLLTVLLVASYGFVVWFYQIMLSGPPTG